MFETFATRPTVVRVENAARHAGEVLFGVALGTLYVAVRKWGELSVSRVAGRDSAGS